MSRISRKDLDNKRLLVGFARVTRWLKAQKIGEAFFNSEIPDQRLEEIAEFLSRSDFLKEEIFNPKLK